MSPEVAALSGVDVDTWSSSYSAFTHLEDATRWAALPHGPLVVVVEGPFTSPLSGRYYTTTWWAPDRETLRAHRPQVAP